MVQIIAHRGASSKYRENTLEAFEWAISVGVDGIELDVRRAGEDVLVVHHDAQLQDGRSLLDITPEDMPEWLPTLSEALDVCAGTWVNVEIKNAPDDPGYDAENAISLAVAGLLTAHMSTGPDHENAVSENTRFQQRVLVSSFNVDALSRMRQMNPAIPTGLLVWGQADPVALIERAKAHNVHAIHPQHLLVDRGFVERAQEADLKVITWTVDDPKRIMFLAELGVDAIITDDPLLAMKVLGRDVGGIS